MYIQCFSKSSFQRFDKKKNLEIITVIITTENSFLPRFEKQENLEITVIITTVPDTKSSPAGTGPKLSRTEDLCNVCNVLQIGPTSQNLKCRRGNTITRFGTVIQEDVLRISEEVAAVVDLSEDDVDTDEMDRSDLFHVLPDNDEADDDDEQQRPDAGMIVIIQQAKTIERR